MTTDLVLDASNVRIGFNLGRRRPRFWAVDDVSMQIRKGTTAGLVGESGSGKSTLAKAILGLVPIDSGHIVVNGTLIAPGSRPDHKQMARQTTAVFQDPAGSLNPSLTIGRSIAEPLRAQGNRPPAEMRMHVAQALERVGLESSAAARLPRQFSGGQLQRICIARALITSPELVICDEPVSALDLSVQAQVLNLLKQLQAESGLAYLFISHDMNVVRYMCDDVTVLYRGQVMESGTSRQVTTDPGHPYTRKLLLAAPVADPSAQRRKREELGVPAENDLLTERPSGGCPFAPRCEFRRESCVHSRPSLQPAGAAALVACHRYPMWLKEAASISPPVSDKSRLLEHRRH